VNKSKSVDWNSQWMLCCCLRSNINSSCHNIKYAVWVMDMVIVATGGGNLVRASPSVRQRWRGSTDHFDNHQHSSVQRRWCAILSASWDTGCWGCRSQDRRQGLCNRMCALWHHLVSACEVKLHLIGCWQYLGAVCFWQPLG